MADLIDRQALREAMYHEAFETDSDEQMWDSGCWIRYKMFERILDSLPSAQGYAEFINWLLDEIWDDEMWELNYRAFPELLCRRLVRLGYLKEEGGVYVRLDKQTGGD